MAVGLKVAAANAAIDAVFGVSPSATRRVSLHTAEPLTSNEITRRRLLRQGGRRGHQVDGLRPPARGFGRAGITAIRPALGAGRPRIGRFGTGRRRLRPFLRRGRSRAGRTPAASTSSVTIASGGVYVEFAIT